MHIKNSTYPFHFISSISWSPFPCISVSPCLMSLEHGFQTCEKSSSTYWRPSQLCDLVSLQHPSPTNGSLVCVQYYYWLIILLIISGLRPLDISVGPRTLIHPSTPLAFSIQMFSSWVHFWHSLTLLISPLLLLHCHKTCGQLSRLIARSGDLQNQYVRTNLPQFD